MRKTVVLSVGLLGAFGSALAAPVFSAEPSKFESDHQLIAVSYQSAAGWIDGWVNLHKVMKQDYQRLLDAGDTERAERLKGMIGHCEEFIKVNEGFKNDLEEFARWHRKMAQEPR